MSPCCNPAIRKKMIVDYGLCDGRLRLLEYSGRGR